MPVIQLPKLIKLSKHKNGFNSTNYTNIELKLSVAVAVFHT